MIVEVARGAFDPASATGPAHDLDGIIAACDRHDRVDTLNERVRLELKNRGIAGARLWLAAEGEGFALLRDTDLDVAVHPQARRRGLGTELVSAALAGIDHVEAWSHADHPGAHAIARHFGIPRTRELLVMALSTGASRAPAGEVSGVSVRTFTPDDEAALLQINASAFAHHPEQGDMTAEDFGERAAEAWFDPAGLFLAVDDSEGTVLGFHWTKVHRDSDPAYGEVYVVAVDPAAAGRGIGRLLTAVGVNHLAASGVEKVVLYVEGDNDPAIALYTGQGFTVDRTEVQYSGRVS